MSKFFAKVFKRKNKDSQNREDKVVPQSAFVQPPASKVTVNLRNGIKSGEFEANSSAEPSVSKTRVLNVGSTTSDKKPERSRNSVDSKVPDAKKKRKRRSNREIPERLTINTSSHACIFIVR